MKQALSMLLVAVIAIGVLQPAAASVSDAAPRYRVLVFTKTTGFRHASIPAAVEAVRALGRVHDFAVDATEDASAFTDEGLAPYAAVLFVNTSGDVLDVAQEAALQRYVEGGGGWVGVHGAAATEYDWAWYGTLVGALFDRHPDPQEGTIVVADRVFPATAHLPARWTRFDEWYDFRTNPRGTVHVLMTLDETSYEGDEMGADHPIAWAHRVGEGRSFYTGLGHTAESYVEPLFVQHLLAALEWAAGQVPGDAE